MGYYVNVEPDVNIFVEDLNPQGEKTILFIHGWPGSHKLFEYQFNQLPKEGYRCIGIDCRGFGASDKPWHGYNYDRIADDIYQIIISLGLENITLLGHSTGGALAIRYMARYQEYGISKLVLCAAAAPSLVSKPDFPYGIPVKEVEDIIQGTYNDRPAMLQNFGTQIFFQYVTPSLSDWIFQLGLEASSWGTAAIANAWLTEVGLYEDMAKINVPTLILHSIHDKVCLFPLAIAQRDRIQNSILVPFDQGGHFLFYDERDKFTEELINFIENTES